MKKIIAVALMAFCTTGFIVAQEQQDGLKLFGELKTGLFWYHLDREGSSEAVEEGFIHNSDTIDQAAGEEDLHHLWSQNGRFRLNFQYDVNNIGAKFRFETTAWVMGSSTQNAIFWDYAFVYGYFFNNNLKISAGKMGDSPWGAGGPDLWKELDTTMGMRFEFLPQFIPFIKPGSLNLGFVLNNFDGSAEEIAHYGGKMTLASVLTETVMGIAYTHDFFHVRLSYRMDSLTDGDISEQFVYRLEERVIKKYLPGFQIIANGYWKGLNPRAIYQEGINPDDVDPRESMEFYNWAYILYDPPILFSPLNMSYSAYTRLGYDSIQNTRRKMYVKPGFFFNFFNNLLRVGTAFEFALDVGTVKLDKNAPYLHWYLEPEIRLNLTSNSYAALVYRYYNDYEFRNPSNMEEALNSKTHWINLRVLFTF
jgi:hypothetical protein